MLRRTLVTLAALVLLAGCDIRLDLDDGTPASPIGPTNITNTNTNTSTNNNDRSDTAATNAPPSTPTDPAPLPLPSYGETVTRDLASRNPALVTNSCQDTSGPTAWAFLDQLVQALRAHAHDQRWGYLCKDASCTAVGRDVIAYRASSAETGIWIVDVIGNHCPLPNERAEVRWGALPFETTRRWTAVRP